LYCIILRECLTCNMQGMWIAHHHLRLQDNSLRYVQQLHSCSTPCRRPAGRGTHVPDDRSPRSYSMHGCQLLTLRGWDSLAGCAPVHRSCNKLQSPHIHNNSLKERKGNEEYLYSAFIQRLLSKRSDMDHIVLPANYTMCAFPS